MGNNHGKTQPPKSPFSKGDLKGLSSDRGGIGHEDFFDWQYGFRRETDTPGFARKQVSGQMSRQKRLRTKDFTL